MFKRKSVNDRIAYNMKSNSKRVSGHGNDVAYDIKNKERDSTSAISLWKVTLGKLYGHRGLLWATASVCISAMLSLCIKSLEGKVAASQGMFLRGCAQVLFSLPYLIFYKVSLHLQSRIFILILARSLIGSLSAFMLFLAFQALPVASAKALLYSSPLFTGIFARVCLGERCSVATVFFSCLTVIAITLVVQPPFIFDGSNVTTGNFWGFFCAIIGAVATALVIIFVRFIQTQRIEAYVIIFIYGIVAMVCFGSTATAFGEWSNPSCGIDRVLVIGLVVTGFLEQVSLTLALKTEPALVVSIIRANDVFLSFAIDFLVFDIVPDALTIFGAILVVGSATGMTISVNREKERLLRKDSAHHEDWDSRDQEVIALRSEQEFSS